MEKKFIQALLDALHEVIEVMAKIHVEPDEHQTKASGTTVEGHCVTSILTLSGDRARASMALTFSVPVLLEIARNMLFQDKQKVDDMVIDLAGELGNMVLGGAKRRLEDGGYRFSLSLPTVIFGHDYLVAHQTDAPVRVIPFTSVLGMLMIEASLEELQSEV